MSLVYQMQETFFAQRSFDDATSVEGTRLLELGARLTRMGIIDRPSHMVMLSPLAWLSPHPAFASASASPPRLLTSGISSCPNQPVPRRPCSAGRVCWLWMSRRFKLMCWARLCARKASHP